MAIPRQLPNAITIVRILCAPVFLWMLLADAATTIVTTDGGASFGWSSTPGPLRWWAAVLFTVAIATDGIDGHLARKHHLVTDLGKLLDPIADKALTGCAFVGLSILNELPWWITIVVLVREVGITVHRLVVATDHVVAAAWMGKLKTVAQAVALSLALLPLWTVVGEWIHVVNAIAMSIAVILTVASGIDYVITAVRARRAA
ncbi:MAG: CDP-diacylglycerol--glycerol-3-phosphate 3-phosphatidyltransferase [Microbacterium sp.]